MATKVRNKNIDFLRFLFAFLIVMFHFRSFQNIDFTANFLKGIKHCNICVEFFFIIAGYFLFQNINIKQDTFDFMKRRFFRLAPLIWVYIVLSAVFSSIFHFKFSYDGNILQLFLLNNVGFSPLTGGTGCGVSWFVAVLFWTGVFYFYISKIFKTQYVNLIIWLITVCSLGIFLNNGSYGYGGHTSNIALVFNTGILRGLYGIGIGYFLSMIKDREFLEGYTSNLSECVFSILELGLFGVIMYYSIFSDKVLGQSSFVIVFLFSIMFYLFIVKKGILSKLFDNNISAWLGQSSYAIYVMHPLAGAVCDSILKHNVHYVQAYPYYIYFAKVLIAIIFGIISFYIFEKPLNRLVKRFCN